MRTALYEQPLTYTAAARLTEKEGKVWRKFVTEMGHDSGSALLRKIILREIAKHDTKKEKAHG